MTAILSSHFTLAELTKSNLALRHGVDNTPPQEAVERLKALANHILQPVRDHFGVTIVTSGYRSPEVNRLAGSSPGSQHVRGEAADFECPEVANLSVAVWIKRTLKFDQLILEHWSDADPMAGWVHCSWVSQEANRNQVLTITGTGTIYGLPINEQP